jgi:hypothetical protein
MSDRTPVLNIGWWRNGYHEYDRPAEETVKPVVDGPTRPTDRDVRIRGAVVAVAISMLWLTVSAAGGGGRAIDYVLQSLLYGSPIYVPVTVVVVVVIWALRGRPSS